MGTDFFENQPAIVGLSARAASLLSLLASRGRCRRAGSVALFVVLLVVGAGADAQAQGFGRIEETESNVSYFYHSQPGQATVQVSLWGTISRTGIYEVPDTTALDKLLTMAGGIKLQALQKGQDDPEITVQLYRPRAGEKSLQFEASLRELLKKKKTYPTLRDDDIVIVRTVNPRDPFGWRDALSLASTLGTLVLLGFRLFDRF